MVVWPDIESLIVTLLEDMCYSCTVLPDEGTWDGILDEHGIMVAINRLGGGVDSEGITDTAIVYTLVVAKDRKSALRGSMDLRSKMLNSGCTVVDGFLIDTVKEHEGNVEEFPDYISEDRFVMSAYLVSCRAQAVD